LALLYAAMVEPVEHQAPKPDLDGALARLQASLAVLEAAVARRREAELAQADLAEAFAAMQDDRARLALDLDEVLARARKMETANEEVARRLEAAGVTLKSLIAGGEDTQEPDEVD
jgi:hypothetical protein